MRFAPNRPAGLLLAMAIASCGSEREGLAEYVEQVKARPGVPLPALPSIRQPEEYTFEPAGRRSPFAALAPVAEGARQAGTGPGPDLEREREFLEHYSLDALRMVGSVRTEGALFGLILTPEGLVHRLATGNYLGRNHGRVTSITEREVRLVELVAGANGDYLQRPAAVALAD